MFGAPMYVKEMSEDAQFHAAIFTSGTPFNHFDLRQVGKFPAPPLAAWIWTNTSSSRRHFAKPYAILPSITIDDDCLHAVLFLQFLAKRLLREVVGSS
jgi:hypothetical protein